MKLRFQIYVEEHEIHKEIISNTVLCWMRTPTSLIFYWQHYNINMRILLEINAVKCEEKKNHDKYHVKFRDICKFITSENLSISVHLQGVQRLSIPVVSNSKIIRLWQTLVIFFVARKLHDKQKKSSIAFRLRTCF